MNSDLLDLESVAKQQSAEVTLRFGHGETSATWKVFGKRAEVVRCRGERVIAGHLYPASSVRGIIRELLDRLDWQHVPTTSRYIDKMTPTQLARAYELVKELKEIRATVEGRILDPRHASPRSSLHPQIVQGEDDPDAYRGPEV